MVDNSREKRIKKVKFDYNTTAKEFLRKCNFCEGDKFICVAYKDRYGFPTRTALCRNCGLIFINPRMTKEEYSRFYVDTYRPLVSAYHGRLIDRSTIQEEQRRYAEKLWEFIYPYLAPETKKGEILDIGGSTGIVLEYLIHNLNCKGVCLDPSPEELAVAESKGLETICSFFEDYNDFSRKFNLILLCQTIDHLLDIKTTLVNIRRILRENGLFFFDIVDFRAAYLRNKSVEDAIKVDHPYYLFQDTAHHIVEGLGFEIISVNWAEDKLHIGFLCKPASSRRSDKGYNPGFFEDIIENIIKEMRFIQNYHFSE